LSEQATPTDQTLSDSHLAPPTSMPPVTLSTPPGSDFPQTLAPSDFPPTLAPADEAHAAGRMPREQLGRFEVHGEIGRGGMGAVLRGRDPALGRDLALKVLLRGHHRNADALRRFHEEAQIGGQLQHPGLVPV
jgi:hypothetical protein